MAILTALYYAAVYVALYYATLCYAELGAFLNEVLVVLDAAVLLAVERGIVHLGEPLREPRVVAGVLLGKDEVGDRAVDRPCRFDMRRLVRNQPSRLV